MSAHNWNIKGEGGNGYCTRCGIVRKHNLVEGEFPYVYRTPAHRYEIGVPGVLKRPVCEPRSWVAGMGSRTSRRNGRRARVLEASRHPVHPKPKAVALVCHECQGPRNPHERVCSKCQGQEP